MDALIEKELALLETFLDKDFVAHTDAPTVADYAVYCETDQLEMVGVDLSKYKKVSVWMDRMKKLLYHDEVHEPLGEFLTKYGLRATVDEKNKVNVVLVARAMMTSCATTENEGRDSFLVERQGLERETKYPDEASTCACVHER
ncbi:Glutathione S-transferase theta-1 [Phytophthora boehmeriae]|uniref:Glutathione S-transferase theta-1 n=1 Tax=Phytophthora boehmeriae TaxID=109152 RepID=A0A8T1WRM6_9STRA|nr:Glutathione S-transferase theta-1 [Phytophthora boehmeriae]